MELDEDVINIKFMLAKLFNSWHLFAACTFICLSLATVYGYFASSGWKIRSEIWVDDIRANTYKESSIKSSHVKSDTDDEIEKLKSRILIAQVVQQMQLNVRTYGKSGLKFQEIYENVPFKTTIQPNRDTFTKQEYIIEIKDDKHYLIQNSKEQVNQNTLFNQPISLPHFKFVLNKTNSFKKRGKYIVTVQPLNEVVSELLNNFSAQFTDKQATNIDLSLIYPDSKKGEAILDKIMSLYLQNNFPDKSSIADRPATINNKSLALSPYIIDTAKSDFLPFNPKKSTIYIFGLILGTIVPAIYLFIKEVHVIRINTMTDVRKITSIPIIGEICHNIKAKNLVISESSCTVISEQFKRISANLKSILNNQKSPVLLFTSSMSGEGKSFLALNLGSALALSDKKVVFIELDLRKPKLSENVGMDNSNGYANYAISDTVTIDSILKPVWFNKNCFLITSGVISPNPAGLLMSNKLEKLIVELKKRFDYIIIDCSPIGIVDDALLIEKLTDFTFYVVRKGYTSKSQLGIVNDWKCTSKVKNLYLIINDMKLEG